MQFLPSTLFTIVNAIILSLPLGCNFLPFYAIVSGIEGISTCNFLSLYANDDSIKG
jgi:hypothetical protein